MSKKLICVSVEKGAPNVIITFNNGVHPDKQGHQSGSVIVEKGFYNKACKERSLFNKILGIDIRMGWQNALKDAISNAQDLSLNIDVERVVGAVAEADVKLRGADVVQADIDKIEKGNKVIADGIEANVEKKVKASKNKKKSENASAETEQPKEKENVESETSTSDGTNTSADTSGADAGNENADAIPVATSVAGDNV